MGDAMMLARPTIRDIRRRAERLDRGLFAVGIELLPYAVVAVVVDSDGAVHDAVHANLVSMEVADFVPRVVTVARELVAGAVGLDLADSRVCIGLQLGGPVDRDTGVVRFYRNNPHDHGDKKPPYTWTDVHLADLVEQAAGCATIVDNDAQAYTAYELARGIGRDVGSFAVVLIRHGVGAGVVVDHRLLPIPMELGHLLVWPDGRLCECGHKACIESRAGRRAIPAVVAERTGVNGDMVSFEWAVGVANGRERVAAQALEAFREAGTAIARGVGTILTLFGSRHVVVYGPEDLVVRGPRAAAANTFLDEVDTFPEYAFRHLGAESVLTTKPLDLVQGAHGAALIALSRHFSVPFEGRLERTR